MTVYMDPPRSYPKRRGLWSHLMTDGPIEELHEMAAKIGLQRDWFQDHPMHPHYDIGAERLRDKAKRLGVVLVTSEVMVRKCSSMPRKCGAVHPRYPELECQRLIDPQAPIPCLDHFGVWEHRGGFMEPVVWGPMYEGEDRMPCFYRVIPLEEPANDLSSLRS